MSATTYTRAIFFEEVFSTDFDDSFPRDWLEVEIARAELSRRYDVTFGNLGFRVPAEAPEKLADVDFILSSKAFEQEGDEYTGFWVRLLPKRKDDFINEWGAATPEAQRLRKLGSDARIKAISKSARELGWFIENSDHLTVEALPSHLPADPLDIPASDRVVSRNDNQQAYEQIEKSLEEVSHLLRSDNELGDELGDGRDLIAAELDVGKEVTNRGRFRVASLLGWLSPALRFLAEKFASGAIGDAAKRLLDLLIGLL